ncbi:nucleotide sugar dehydrogenase [Eubacterium sp. MSJ-13]|uniref:nucleotide sugar dehydrogenase n=1 Tax=Eubacterium sp. MSJ-13 TaxID=2841513 RepID=UPI001C115A23|nr:nucleotide sugar dehydrogenase [Eubacterium sp. MSJ-13]MBU5477600.1 nucleotide sugar dehydrogenase [Eubacterium sp. MSJ-13]
MSKLYNKLVNKQATLSLIGLGYVGMPIAVAFANEINVIGYDKNSEKIESYRNGVDPTNEVGDEIIKKTKVDFTDKAVNLEKAMFHIVAVPTPVKEDHTPDLRPVISASEELGKHLVKGSIVVYESTVYPGVTEEICVPILERESGLKCGEDFKVGYSPERINPGDKVHRLDTIVKIVSGMDEESLEEIANVYQIVAKAGVYKAESIKVAEAAKVIENSQRDINIAFMNELSIIFDKMNIDTKSVLEAAGTKWNFLKFYPGLVGGHCIGVDPYYLAYKAEQIGYHPEVIMAGRRINDSMGKYIAETTIKKIIKADLDIKKVKVCILGFTFKENCPDTRNTKVYDIVKELQEYGIMPDIYDPVADCKEAKRLYDVNILNKFKSEKYNVYVIAVGHDNFKNEYGNLLEKDYLKNKKVIIDVKGIFDNSIFSKEEYVYWRL